MNERPHVEEAPAPTIDPSALAMLNARLARRLARPTAPPEPTIENGKRKGDRPTHKNREETKKRRKMVKASRRKNRKYARYDPLMDSEHFKARLRAKGQVTIPPPVR